MFAMTGERATAAWRGAHRRRRARAGPGRACRPRRATGRRSGSPRGSTRSSSPSRRGPRGRARRRRFRRPPQRPRPPLSLSHRQPPRAADARARPRLAGEAAARRRGDARGGAARSSAGTISPPFATRNARRNRRSAPSTGSTSCATATRSRSRSSALSFLHRQVRSMVGSLVDVGAGRWTRGRPQGRARSRRPQPLRPGRPGLRALSDAGRLSGGAKRCTSPGRSRARVSRRAENAAVR